jgi:hypothetical protein
VNDLNLEVQALLTLTRLDLTPDQLKNLAALAKGAAQKPMKRPPAKVSNKYRSALINLHAALAKGDDAKVLESKEKMEDLMESEEIDLDEDVPISDEARTRAAKFLRQLSPSQVATFLGGLTLTDPGERLVDGLEEVRGLDSDDDKKEACEDIANEVSRLVGGDTEQGKQVQEKVVALLTRAQGLKDADYKKQKDSLEKAARDIVGAVSPIEVLGHIVENGLAQLLANPRLEAALRIEREPKKD